MLARLYSVFAILNIVLTHIAVFIRSVLYAICNVSHCRNLFMFVVLGGLTAFVIYAFVCDLFARFVVLFALFLLSSRF